MSFFDSVKLDLVGRLFGIRNRGLAVTCCAVAVASTIAFPYIRRDYQTFLSGGPSYAPQNIRGYLIVCVLALFRQEQKGLAIYDRLPEKRRWLPDLPPRDGPRPITTSHIIQRQVRGKLVAAVTQLLITIIHSATRRRTSSSPSRNSRPRSFHGCRLATLTSPISAYPSSSSMLKRSSCSPLYPSMIQRMCQVTTRCAGRRGKLRICTTTMTTRCILRWPPKTGRKSYQRDGGSDTRWQALAFLVHRRSGRLFMRHVTKRSWQWWK